MLGPEQVNFMPRPAPVLMEGLEAIRVTDQVAKNIGLQDNQVVRAAVEDRQGILKLVLNNREFDWKSSKRFKAGDFLNFKVISGKSETILQPIASNSASSISSPTLNNLLGGGDTARIMSLFYRPNQPSSVAKFFSPDSLTEFLSKVNDRNISLKIDQLLQSMRSYSPEMVRSALQNSGLFGESMLTKYSSQKSDLKQILRAILNLGGLTKSELTTIAQAVDEIESNQLDSIQASRSRGVSYNFVIPFSDSDPVEINIESEGSDSSAEELNRTSQNIESTELNNSAGGPRTTSQNWVVNLYTDSQELGEIWSKATLKSEKSADLILWAKDPQAVQLAKDGELFLGELFAGFGISLKKFIVLNAERPTIEKSLTGPGQVLDVRT